MIEKGALMDHGHATKKEKAEIGQLLLQVKEYPTDSVLLTRLGAMLFVVCNFPPNEARDYLQRAVELDPKNVDVLFWLAKCWYHDFADSEKARKYLEQALAVAPSRSDCLSLMAAVLSDLQAESAIILSYIDRAIICAPDWVIPYEQRVRLLIELHRFSEAEQEINIIEKLIQQRISPPQDSIKEYYESSVTGRSVTDISFDLRKYVESMAKKKL